MPGGDFRATSGDLFRENAEEARRLLAEAGYPGGRRFPRVKYLYNDREDHRLIAQALQGMWLSTLGVRVELDVQDWKVFLQNRKQGNYQFARAGWIGDYLDPVNFLDMYTSNAGNNDAFYKNPEYDRLIAEAGTTADSARRVKLLREAEAMLIGRDMAVAPIYFYVREFAQKPHVKGVVRNPVGNIYFDGAFVEP
jgi:oligopeptide transport system substrate-binding protein